MFEREIANIAARQLSLITLHQALEVGLTEQSVRRRVQIGSWERVHPTVYRLAGAPVPYPQRLMGACLAIGPEAAASHRAAAHLDGMLTFKDPPVEVTTTRARSPELEGVIVHRLADLWKGWVTAIDGVPCTVPARTLVDLGAVCRPSTVEAAFDRAIGRRLTTPRDVRRMMRAVARQGRRGVGTIRGILVDRLEDKPAGVFSARMSSLLRSASLPHAVAEYVVLDEHGGFLGIVDFAYPERLLAIEVDGYEAHMILHTFRNDRARDRLLRDAGWEVLHFTWQEVDRREPHVAREIAKWYRRRAPELGISAR